MTEHYYTSAPTSQHEERHFNHVFAGKVLRFQTDAGVFSKQHVDPGSELLCKALPDPLGTRGLDMGCGWGAMAGFVFGGINYLMGGSAIDWTTIICDYFFAFSMLGFGAGLFRGKKLGCIWGSCD